MTSSRPRARRSQQAEPVPGVVKVRLRGDTFAADVLAEILRTHPAVEILTGPDRYDNGRQYLAVRVQSPAEVLAAASALRLRRVQCPATMDAGMPEGPERCQRDLHSDNRHENENLEWWDEDESDGGIL